MAAFTTHNHVSIHLKGDEQPDFDGGIRAVLLSLGTVSLRLGLTATIFIDNLAQAEALAAAANEAVRLVIQRDDDHLPDPVEDELHVLTCSICGKAVRTADGGKFAIHAQV